MENAVLQSTSVRQAIDAANRQFEASFAAGNPGRAAEDVYTRNARVLPPGSPIIQGRDNIIAFWETAARQLGIESVQLHTMSIELAGDHAHEIGQGTLLLVSGKSEMVSYVVIWKQEDGKWCWDIDIWNITAQQRV
jgi:ketosteroid isomerase-like protein